MAKIYEALNKIELEQFLNFVAETILQGNMSLFLGAGSSIQYNAMSWNELMNSVSSKCSAWKNTERAQYAELKGIDIKEEVAKVIGKLDINSKKQDTYLYHLLNFDYKSLWTTNYDSVIESVLDEKSKQYIPVYKYKHFQRLSYPSGCFLFKINGSYIVPDTIVITSEDFIDYKKTHEAYLILLKRELLCNSFLFLGCSFDDDILRICIKDILNCIDNSTENYSTNHFAIIVENNYDKLDYISQDLVKHYNINCLKINNASNSHMVAYAIANKVKYNSIFVSGAKRFVRNSEEENFGKQVCRNLVDSFMEIKDFPFKFISGMGMSIGHFICGTVKQNCQGSNVSRYLQMEPFPFTNAEANRRHREEMISKAGIFIFIYGDVDGNEVEKSGMWKEYIMAKSNPDNIIIPLPCGEDSVSSFIYKKEKTESGSFAYEYFRLIDAFNYKSNNEEFFKNLVEKIILVTRKKMDQVLNVILEQLKK